MAERLAVEKPTLDPDSPSIRRWSGSAFGLAAALCWAISPVFIRRGLEGFHHPVLAVTIGVLVATMAHGTLLLFRRHRYEQGPVITFALWRNQGLAGILNGLGLLFRWIALDLAPVGIVLTLTRVNMIVVIVVSAFLKGDYAERLTWRVWLGAALVLVGAVILGLD